MAELSEMRARLSSVLEENDRIIGAVKVEEGGVAVSTEQATTFRKNLDEARQLKSVIETMEGQAEIREFANAVPLGGGVALSTKQGIEEQPPQAQYRPTARSLGEMFVASDEFKGLVASGGATMIRPWVAEDVDLTSIQSKDVYGGMTTINGHGLGTMQHDPIVDRGYRRNRVRDLFPVASTSANLIDYFRVVGFGANRLSGSSAASAVPDYAGGAFGLKPHSSLTFEAAQAAVRTIAHWEAAHRNVLQDTPQLQSIINNELLYGLRIVEDNQILYGTGTGEDLLGIMNTPNIQTYAKGASDAQELSADAIRRAITKVALAWYDPTGVVLHPENWESIEVSRGSDGHYVYTANVAVGAERRLWTLPVVDTPAITKGTALVGAFGLGAQIYDRQQASVRIAEQHSDFFIRNAVVILAEERLALAVKRPEAFVKVTALT